MFNLNRLAIGVLAVAALSAPLRGAIAGDAASPAVQIEIDNASGRPELTLRAQASVSVLQDTVTMVFASNVQGKSAPEINQQLAQSIDRARRLVPEGSEVKVSSGQFRVTPIFGKDGKIGGWQGHAELVLVTTDFPAIAALSTRMAEQLELASVYFSLSDQARQSEEAKLLDQVAAAFRDRAQRAATAFGYAQYTVKRLDLGGAGAAPQPPMPAPMVMRAAAAPDAPPRVDVPLVPDRVNVSASVSGTVYLR